MSINSSLSKNFAWFLVVLIFGLLFRLIFLNAPLQSDDTNYFLWASNFSTELLTNATYQAPFRLGILIPLAIIQQFFGYSLVSYYFFSVSASLFLLSMVFALGLKLDGFRTAIFSSLLFACSFFGLYQATNLLPDVPNAALLLASFLLFVPACEKYNGNYSLLLIASAVLAFASYLVRAPNLAFLLAIPIYEILARKSLKFTFLFSVVFFVLWLAECIFYKILADDFFLRIKMIPSGANQWMQFMPEISWKTYLLAPIDNLIQTSAGIILLLGGFSGTLMALARRNKVLIALLAGALLLFIIYSYAVTSFSPLRRALPLNTRYIVVFTAILTIATGYALTTLRTVVGKKNFENFSNLALIFVTVFLMSIQISELSRKLPNTVLFNDGSYFVADQLLNDFENKLFLKGKVEAYPVKDFNMYPNFSQLDLKGFSPTRIEGDKYYLYSRNRIHKDLRYGWHGQNEANLRNLGLFMLSENPKWNYLINTKDIVLAYIPGVELIPSEAVTLDGSIVVAKWGKPEGVTEERVGNSIKFQFDRMDKPFYLYLFPETFSTPPNDRTELFSKLRPNSVYELKIQYRVKNDMKNIGIFYHEYDESTKIDSMSFNAPTSSGLHIATKILTTSSLFKKFRLFIRIDDNQKKNEIIIENISFVLIS